MIKVPAHSLRIHPTAQRPVVEAGLQWMTEHLDLDLLGVLHAVEATIDHVTAYWVFDGQTRLKSVLANGLDDWPMDVMVHLNAQTKEAASEGFLGLNNTRVVGPYPKFLNEAIAKHPDAMGVLDCLGGHGLAVGSGCADGQLCCVSTLKKLWKLDQGVALGWVCDVILQSWGTGRSALEGRIVEGLGIFYRRFSKVVEMPTLVKKLAKYPGGPPHILGDSKSVAAFERCSSAKAVAMVILNLYNQGRRTGRLEPL